MAIEHTDFQATLIMMDERQSTEETLREIGYHVGVDFQTNKPRYFIPNSDKTVSLNARNFPYLYSD